MKNKNYTIFLIESLLNIFVSIWILISAILDMTIKSQTFKVNIILTIVSSLFLLISIFNLIITLRKKIISTLLTNVFSIVLSILIVVSLVLKLININLIFLILFFADVLVSIIFHILTLSDDAFSTNKYPHLKRNRVKSPTCTIQISTEYLVKESYTPEEAERTIKQLYSLHENDGFSMKDYEMIKEKILKNTKND